MSYEEAKKIVKKLNLKGMNDYNSLVKNNNLPKGLPNYPRKTYKNKGWISSGDFLGTNVIATYLLKYESYENCQKFLKKYKI